MRDLFNSVIGETISGVAVTAITAFVAWSYHSFHKKKQKNNSEVQEDASNQQIKIEQQEATENGLFIEYCISAHCVKDSFSGKDGIALRKIVFHEPNPEVGVKWWTYVVPEKNIQFDGSNAVIKLYSQQTVSLWADGKPERIIKKTAEEMKVMSENKGKIVER